MKPTVLEEKRDVLINSNTVKLLRCDTEPHSQQRNSALEEHSCMPLNHSHHELLAGNGNSTQDLINTSPV